MTDDALTDEGLISDARPAVAASRIPLRARLHSMVGSARMSVGSWIAGIDLDHECEW